MNLTRYRNDSTEGLDEKLRQYLDQNYFAKLPNLNTTNPKLLVVFSGGNALGKSTIAAKISNELKGLVIETDAIKKVILQYDPMINQAELNPITWQYSMNLYKRIGSLTPNGLIVRDSVIDWYYDRILPIFENAGYKLFIIAFDVSVERRRELILNRGDKQTISSELLLAQIPDHLYYSERFRKEYKPDIILTDVDLFDHNLVIKKLKEKLASMG